MGARKLFLFNTQFSCPNMGSVKEFLSQVFIRFFANFRVFVSAYLLPLFGVISKYFFRLNMKGDSVEDNSGILYETNEKIVLDYMKAEWEKGFEEYVFDYRASEGDEVGEKETTEFRFEFKFPRYEEFSRMNRGSDDSVSAEAITSTNIGKYEFMPMKSFSAFVEELEPCTVHVEEVNAESNGASPENRDIDNEHVNVSGKNVNSPTEEEEEEEETEDVHVTTNVNLFHGVTGAGPNEKKEKMIFRDDRGEDVSDKNVKSPKLEEEEYVRVKTNETLISGVTEAETNVKNEDVILRDDKREASDNEHDVQAFDEIEYSSMDSDYKWIGTDGFLSDRDFGGTFELYHLIDVDDQKTGSSEKSSDFESEESYDFDGEDSDIMEELRGLEDDVKSDFLSEKDFDEPSIKKSESSEFSESKNSSAVENEDTTKLETLWEHQDLIEQLKVELKKVRATGLPTIFEDSESPKIVEDLKPWKIDEKFQHESPMGELHKFYKSYRERMRKLDILTYQKTYAIGFLQLKDPDHSNRTKKTSIPDIASFLSENMYLHKAKKYDNDPMKKLINELQSDLELVYVGQMCLSWEVLHWQYGMALNLWDSDPRGIRQYNEVAGEFQQFQVLVQRFIEDEPFQGPRVHNYIKHRCGCRNFLQVPVIREDTTNDRKKGKRSSIGDYSITSDMLVEIVEESIRLFWHFVRADKHCTNVKVMRSHKRLVVDLQDPEVLLEIQKDLQKKKKKLKEQLRSSKSILKKFRNCQEIEEASDRFLFFFSQVDMKLVSRVLRMSQLNADQLAWCRNKLSTVSFVNKKIHVEPSFCLFPC